MATKTRKSTTAKKNTSSSVKGNKKTTRLVEKTTPVSTSSTRTTTATRSRSFNFSRRHVLTLVLIALAGILLYANRGRFVIAMVNGQPISHAAFEKQLETYGGKQIEQLVITNALVEQEAKKHNITVSAKEINDEINKVRQDPSLGGQSLEQAMTARGYTMDRLAQEVRVQKLEQKLIGPVTVTDKEIDDYMKQNADSLPKDQKPEDLKKSIKQQLTTQKQQEKQQQYVQDLFKKAKITYIVQY